MSLVINDKWLEVVSARQSVIVAWIVRNYARTSAFTTLQDLAQFGKPETVLRQVSAAVKAGLIERRGRNEYYPSAQLNEFVKEVEMIYLF